MQWCDTRSSVIEWNSEEVVVPYRSALDDLREKKEKLNYQIWHRYYVDFYIKVKQRDGTTKRYLIEVKPKSQTVEPVKPANATRSKTYKNARDTWIVNQAKWAAAREYAADRKMGFKLITEAELYGK